MLPSLGHSPRLGLHWQPHDHLLMPERFHRNRSVHPRASTLSAAKAMATRGLSVSRRTLSCMSCRWAMLPSAIASGQVRGILYSALTILGGWVVAVAPRHRVRIVQMWRTMLAPGPMPSCLCLTMVSRLQTVADMLPTRLSPGPMPSRLCRTKVARLQTVAETRLSPGPTPPCLCLAKVARLQTVADMVPQR